MGRDGVTHERLSSWQETDSPTCDNRPLQNTRTAQVDLLQVAAVAVMVAESFSCNAESLGRYAASQESLHAQVSIRSSACLAPAGRCLQSRLLKSGCPGSVQAARLMSTRLSSLSSA